MRKVALISIILLFSITLAQVEIKFEKVYYTILPTENKINFTIKNLENKEISIVLNIFPSVYNGISCSLPNYFISLKPLEEKTLELKCVVPITTPSFSYKLSVFAYLEGKLSNETYIILNVIRKYEIIITSYKIYKEEISPEESNFFEINLKNVKDELSEEYYIVFQIEKDGKIVKSEKRFVPKLVPYQEYKATYQFSFSYYDEPGKYLVYAKVYNKNDVLIFEVYKPLTLREVKTYEISKSVEQSLYISTVKIKVKNTGNVPQTLEVKETLPSFVTAFLKFYQEPKIEQKGASSEIIWQVYVLPQEEAEIVYEFVFWPAVVAASVIGVISIYLLSLYFTPLIFRKVQKEEKFYKIRLVAKNTSRKTIKNVIIQDFVPKIFEIVEFETKKPEIKRTKDGYVLIWNINELKPKEEAIISYKIKPLIQIIGEPKFSRPKMIYTVRNKKKKETKEARGPLKP